MARVYVKSKIVTIIFRMSVIALFKSVIYTAIHVEAENVLVVMGCKLQQLTIHLANHEDSEPDQL